MDWQIVVALVLVIPVILVPVLLVWYLNIGGIYTAIRERQAACGQTKKMAAETGQHIAAVTEGHPEE